MRPALALALLASTAHAETVHMGGDTITIADASTIAAVVTYTNHAESKSEPGSALITAPNGIAVWVTVSWAKGSTDETILVEPVDPGTRADPPHAQVPDGDSVDIYVERLAF